MSDIKKIQEQVKKHGYTVVTTNPMISSGHHPYHFTVGLTNMNLPEIFISGRLPVGTVREIIRKLIVLWETKKAVVTGVLPNFIALAGAVYAPALVVPVDAHRSPLEVEGMPDDTFKIMDEVIDGASTNVMQLLWPDNMGILPIVATYSPDPEYFQVLLPMIEEGNEDAMLNVQGKSGYWAFMSWLEKQGAGAEVLEDMTARLKEAGFSTSWSPRDNITFEDLTAPYTDNESSFTFEQLTPSDDLVLQYGYISATGHPVGGTVTFKVDPITNRAIGLVEFNKPS